MCLIAFSPKGVDIPTPEQIKTMWKANSDGAGYAYVGKGGKVFYHKGFMTLDALLKELKDPEKFKNTNFAIHFRIGTSGKNDAKTCHPFPISNNFGDLRKTSGKTDSVLFHNGVVGNGGLASPLSSDTQDFVIALAPLLQKYNKSKTRDYFIEELVSGSRLLLLYKNNMFKMYGDWKKDGDLWVSNLNYKYSYSWYGDSYYNYATTYLSDYYDDYYAGYGTNATAEEKEKAEVLWSEILKNEYKFVSEEELDLLKKTSEYYTEAQIELDDYVLGYDKKQLLVWVETTPPLVEDIKEEE